MKLTKKNLSGSYVEKDFNLSIDSSQHYVITYFEVSDGKKLMVNGKTIKSSSTLSDLKEIFINHVIYDIPSSENVRLYVPYNNEAYPHDLVFSWSRKNNILTHIYIHTGCRN